MSRATTPGRPSNREGWGLKIRLTEPNSVVGTRDPTSPGFEPGLGRNGRKSRRIEPTLGRNGTKRIEHVAETSLKLVEASTSQNQDPVKSGPNFAGMAQNRPAPASRAASMSDHQKPLQRTGGCRTATPNPNAVRTRTL